MWKPSFYLYVFLGCVIFAVTIVILFLQILINDFMLFDETKSLYQKLTKWLVVVDVVLVSIGIIFMIYLLRWNAIQNNIVIMN